jgi:hypothetical protein
MTDEEVKTRSQLAANFWRSWDCRLRDLTISEELQLLDILSMRGKDSLLEVPHAELRAAADLLAEQYENYPLTR